MIFVVAGIYIFRSYLGYSWIWSIVAGYFSGEVASLLFINGPFRSTTTAVEKIVETNISALEKRIDEKLNDYHLKSFTEVHVEIYLLFKKLEGSYIDMLFSELRYIPRVGDKLYISKLQGWGYKHKFWHSEKEYEEIEKLRPDLNSYEWRVEEVIWHPFKDKISVLVLLN